MSLQENRIKANAHKSVSHNVQLWVRFNAIEIRKISNKLEHATYIERDLYNVILQLKRK